LINNKEKVANNYFIGEERYPPQRGGSRFYINSLHIRESHNRYTCFSTYPNTQCILKRPSVTFNRRGIGKRIDKRIVYREKSFLYFFLPTIDDITYSTSLEHKTCINSFIFKVVLRWH
jgi:hypothetical protein